MEPKQIQRLKQITKISLITGAVITGLSFFLPLIPCTGDGLCSLPNPFINITNLSSEYYGISNNPLTGTILQILIPAIILGLILMIFKKKPKRVLDLTRR